MAMFVSGSSTSTGSFGRLDLGGDGSCGRVNIGAVTSSRVLDMYGQNTDLTIRLGHTAWPSGVGYDDTEYGFYWTYFGTGASNNNDMSFFSENLSDSEPNIEIWECKQNGSWTFKEGSHVNFSGSVGDITGQVISGSILRSSGDVIAYYSSDERLKDNIKLIEKPIEKIQQLRGVEYQWNGLQNTYPSGSLDSGIIAQDVQKVLPQLVKETNTGYLGVRHDRLVGLLVESIKDQQEQINELKLQIKEIKNGSS